MYRDSMEDPALLDNLIKLVPENDLRPLLEEFAKTHSDIRNILSLRYEGGGDRKQVGALKRKVYGFIPTKKAYKSHRADAEYECSVKMEEFLDEYGNQLLENEQYAEAFEVTAYLIGLVKHEQVMDEEHFFCNVADHCTAIWTVVLNHCSKEFKLTMLSILEEYLRSPGVDYDVFESVNAFLDNNFREKESCEIRLSWLEKDIKKLEKHQKIYNYAISNLDHALKMKLDYMCGAKMLKKDIQKVYDKYYKYHSVRLHEIKSLEKEGRYDDAISLALTSKETDFIPFEIMENMRALIDLYEDIGDMEAYKAEMLAYLFEENFWPEEKDLYGLKKLCTDEEWMRYCDKMLEDDRYEHIWDKILLINEQYDKLFAVVSSIRDLDKVLEYENIFKERYPEETRDLIAKNMLKAQPGWTFPVFDKSFLTNLYKIASYPDGDKKAKEVADKLRQMYFYDKKSLKLLSETGF